MHGPTKSWKKLGNSGRLKSLKEILCHRGNFIFCAGFYSPVLFSLREPFFCCFASTKRRRFFFEKTTDIVGGFFRSFVEVFDALDKREKAAFLLAAGLLLLWRIKLLLFVPLNYDEAYSFLNFSSRGPLIAASYYKVPNNHIFFSVLSSLFVKLPLESTLALRLPSFLAAWVSSCLIFVLIGKQASPRAGFAAALLFSFSIPVALYASLGRGYSLVILFFLTGLHAAFKIIGGASSFYWVFLSAACVLGCFTTPVFVDPAAVLYLFIFWQLLIQKKTAWKEMIFSAVAVVLLTVLLYAPALAVSGVRSFMNPAVLPDNRQEVARAMPLYLVQLFDWLAGGHFGFWGVSAAVPALGWLAFKKTGGIKLFAQCALLFLLSVPCWVMAHGVLPYFRIWIYMVVFLAASFPLFFSSRIVYAVCAFSVLFGIIRFDAWHREYYPVDHHVGDYIRSLTGIPLGSVYTDYDHFDVLFRYQYRKKNFQMNSGTLPFDENQKYDLLVLKKPLSLPLSLLKRHYRIHFDDPSFQGFISNAEEKP